MKEMSQLSGGQKSLVAMVIWFFFCPIWSNIRYDLIFFLIASHASLAVLVIAIGLQHFSNLFEFCEFFVILEISNHFWIIWIINTILKTHFEKTYRHGLNFHFENIYRGLGLTFNLVVLQFDAIFDAIWCKPICFFRLWFLPFKSAILHLSTSLTRSTLPWTLNIEKPWLTWFTNWLKAPNLSPLLSGIIPYSQPCVITLN